jgi:hypothetical protein
MDILKNIGELQGKMQEIKEQLAATTVVGESGAGMVKVTLDGEFRLRGVEISSEAIDREDPALLQDLVAAAHADAHTKVRDALRENLSGLTGGLPIPGLFGG